MGVRRIKYACPLFAYREKGKERGRRHGLRRRYVVICRFGSAVPRATGVAGEMTEIVTLNADKSEEVKVCDTSKLFVKIFGNKCNKGVFYQRKKLPRSASSVRRRRAKLGNLYARTYSSSALCFEHKYEQDGLCGQGRLDTERYSRKHSCGLCQHCLLLLLDLLPWRVRLHGQRSTKVSLTSGIPIASFSWSFGAAFAAHSGWTPQSSTQQSEPSLNAARDRSDHLPHYLRCLYSGSGCGYGGIGSTSRTCRFTEITISRLDLVDLSEGLCLGGHHQGVVG